MYIEATKTAQQPVARIISHNQRAKSSDVNPLLQSSEQPITSAADNFIVGRQADGKLSNVIPGFKLPFKEKWFKPFKKYYEVDKSSYLFTLELLNTPSAQPTIKFNVILEFNLKVIEPCAVVQDNCTSLLDCIMLDLKRCVHDVTSKFSVQAVGQASTELQTALLSFNSPPFLRIVFGVIEVAPDRDAASKMREMEGKQMELDVIDSRGAVGVKQQYVNKIVGKAADGLEEHQIQKLVPESVKMINM